MYYIRSTIFSTWRSDRSINSPEYKRFEIYAGMAEYHHWIDGQA